MKNSLPLLLLLSIIVLSHAQTYPQVDGPVSMNVSLPAEMSGHGKIEVKITLHYRTGGTHHFRDSVFSFILLDEKGDQIRSQMSVLRSQLSSEVELEGTDPEYAPRIEFKTMADQRPLTKGARYQLVVFCQGPGIIPMANVKSFRVTE
jgi:hypothetical protein